MIEDYKEFEELRKQYDELNSFINEYKTTPDLEQYEEDYFKLLINRHTLAAMLGYNEPEIFQTVGFEEDDFLVDLGYEATDEDIEYAIRYAREKYGFDALVCDAEFPEDCCPEE